MGMTGLTVLILALLRAAAGLVIFGWLIWSAKRMHSAVTDLRDNWDRWETYPVPDKRAVWNISLLMWYSAGWLFLTAILTAYLGWVIGSLP